MSNKKQIYELNYVPGWYNQLDELAKLALPKPWCFRNPIYLTKNPDTPILERYIHTVFRKQAIDFNNEPGPYNRDSYFHVRNETACFHTGLYTPRYKPIYVCFDRNKKRDTMDGYYLGNTCLTLEMAYLNARLLARPTARWLAELTI